MVGVYMANFYKAKGQRYLLEGLIPVIRRHENFRVLLLGDGVDHPRVVERVRQVGLQERVFCPGRVPRKFVPWVLKHSDLAFAPTYSENVGHNCVEPMMVGIPVIGTKAGTGGYLIQDYLTGIKVAFNRPGQITAATDFLVSHPQACKRMGERAKAFSTSIFAHRDIAEAHVTLYNRFLAPPE
jgi:glycosyltransferase involved in cell wall biosynthesis